MLTGGSSLGFRETNKYDVSDHSVQAAKRWEQDNMYKTSYYKQSEKNVNS